MARRPFRKALASFVAGALDVSPTSPITAPARDAVPDDASELFGGIGGRGGLFGFGTSVMVNALNRAGTAAESSFWTRWITQRFLGRQEQYALGRNALSRQALAKIGDTATREGWTVEVTDATDEDKKAIATKITDYETKIGSSAAIPDACLRGRQYGDALVILGIVDGRDPDQPVDLDNLQTIKWAAVVDRRDFDYESVGGPESSKYFGKPEKYRITDLDGVLQDGIRYFGEGTTNFTSAQLAEFYQSEAQSGQLLIHADRTLRFPTADALSMLDGIQDSLEAFLATADGARKAAQDSGTVVYKISNLLRKNWHENGGQVATDHIRAVHAGKAAANAYIIDKTNEEIEALPNNLGGLADLVNVPMMWLAAALNIPTTEFWQVSPGGFGTGDSEAARWHVTANAYQKQVLTPELRKLHGYILVAHDAGIHLPADTRRKIVYGDLSPADETTRSELRSQAIEDMIKLFEAQGITREELRLSLPSDDQFSIQLQAEEKTEQLPEAPVGVWTGTIALLQAVYPAGVPGDAAAQAAQLLGPGRFTPENTGFFAQRSGPPSMTPGAGVPGMPGNEGAPMIADPEGEEDGEIDEHAQAWEQGREPDDTRTSSEIAEILRVSPQRVTAFAKKNNIKNWDALGGRGRYSLREIQRLSMERNDTAPPQKLAVMIPIPEAIADQFPPDEKRGAPHVTALSIGEYGAADRSRVFGIASGVVAQGFADFALELGPVDYFDQPDDGQRVAFVEVTSKPSLKSFHDTLREALESAGIDVEHDGSFKPHATLAYLAPDEDFDGTPPVGEWSAQPELWWGDDQRPLKPAAAVE